MITSASVGAYSVNTRRASTRQMKFYFLISYLIIIIV